MNRTRCKPLIIGCVYRPPNQQVDKFLEDFNNSLAGIESHFDKIILGDFNIDYSSKKGSNVNQSDRRKLKGIADLHDMKQIIDLPTRIAEHSESQIDLIFTDNVHKIIDFGVKDFGISDHLKNPCHVPQCFALLFVWYVIQDVVYDVHIETLSIKSKWRLARIIRRSTTPIQQI